MSESNGSFFQSLRVKEMSSLLSRRVGRLTEVFALVDLSYKIGCWCGRRIGTNAKKCGWEDGEHAKKFAMHCRGLGKGLITVNLTFARDEEIKVKILSDSFGGGFSGRMSVCVLVAAPR